MKLTKEEQAMIEVKRQKTEKRKAVMDQINAILDENNMGLAVDRNSPLNNLKIAIVDKG